MAIALPFALTNPTDSTVLLDSLAVPRQVKIFPSLCGNPKVNYTYRIHIHLQMAYVPSHMNPLHTLSCSVSEDPS